MCCGRSFRPSSGVQDCAYSKRHLSNGYCCLLASGYLLASRQQFVYIYIYSKHTAVYIYIYIYVCVCVCLHAHNKCIMLVVNKLFFS